MAGVTIRLLGGFAASVGDEPVAEGAWRLKKGREVVKLLALAHGQRLHREQLMDELWRELDPAAAANNLYQAVHVARRVLGADAIQAQDGLLLLAADVDVPRFEAAAVAARRAGTVAAYRAALACYGGELLPENRYDDFAERRRDALAELHGELVRELEPLLAAGAPLRLPVATSSFIGRRHELDELGTLAGRTRLLTLTGTGGAGKTRLALELASRLQDSFAGGAALVELAPVTDPALVPDALAATLDVQALPEQDVVDAIAGFVATRELLLVLDNCEHVLASAASLAEALLRTAPRLTVLATSREPMRLTGEVVFRVPSLVIPDPEQLPPLDALAGYEAVRLFVERAGAVVPGFELTEENAAHIARICFRLDGLPLAIELAAGRVGGLGSAAIAGRLDDRFRLLRTGSRAAPTRQQTLEATLQWSHDLLEPDERVLFRRLAVFAGGFELGAAEDVCSGDELAQPDVADVLSRLVEKSLVSAAARGGERRYRLLETVRLYARQQLHEAGEATAVARRHAAWALGLAERSPDGVQLDREAANLRAALDTLAATSPDEGLRLCTELMPFWLRRIDLVEAHRRFADLLAATPQPTPLRADALLAASAVDFRAGTMLDGLARVEEALAVAVALGDARAEWRALQRLVDFAVAWDDGATALRHLDALLDLAPAGPPGAEALAVYVRGSAHWLLGEYQAALASLAKSLELFRRLDPADRVPSPLNIADLTWNGIGGLIGPRMVFEETLHPFLEVSSRLAVAHVLMNQAGLVRMRGDLAEARRLADESVALVDGHGEERALAQALVRRAYLDLAEGEPEEARRALERALELRRELNERRGIGIALKGLGLAELVAGDYARADRVLGEARELFRRAGDRWGLASTLWRIGDLRLVQGDYDGADRVLEEALAVLGATRRRRWLAHTLFIRAEVAAQRGEPERARAWYGEARELFEAASDRGGVELVDGRAGATLGAR